MADSASGNANAAGQWSNADAPILIHFGDSDFEDKFLTVLKDVGRWRAEVGSVESVDLRFDRRSGGESGSHAGGEGGKATGGERCAATGRGREFEAGDDIASSRACGFALDFTKHFARYDAREFASGAARTVKEPRKQR